MPFSVYDYTPVSLNMAMGSVPSHSQPLLSPLTFASNTTAPSTLVQLHHFSYSSCTTPPPKGFSPPLLQLKQNTLDAPRDQHAELLWLPFGADPSSENHRN